MFDDVIVVVHPFCYYVTVTLLFPIHVVHLPHLLHYTFTTFPMPFCVCCSCLPAFYVAFLPFCYVALPLYIYDVRCCCCVRCYVTHCLRVTFCCLVTLYLHFTACYIPHCTYIVTLHCYVALQYVATLIDDDVIVIMIN